ncbi:MAG: DUF4178 domain-containing protein [Bacteroidota bacterium]
MGLFDIFKKKDKEPNYDPSNITIKDLNQGFVFDYDLKTWEVVEAYEYDWGSNYFSKEFKISDGNEVLFLEIEEDDELEVSIHKKIKVPAIDPDLPDRIVKKGKPPKKLEYMGVVYFRDDENPGYFRNLADDANKDDSWSELISWSFYDENEEKILTIEQWGEQQFEASQGKYIKHFEVSNILPKLQG